VKGTIDLPVSGNAGPLTISTHGNVVFNSTLNDNVNDDARLIDRAIDAAGTTITISTTAYNSMQLNEVPFLYLEAKPLRETYSAQGTCTNSLNHVGPL